MRSSAVNNDPTKYSLRADLPTFDARFVSNKIEDVEVCLVSHAVVVERKSSVVGRHWCLFKYSTTSIITHAIDHNYLDHIFILNILESNMIYVNFISQVEPLIFGILYIVVW